MYKITTNDYFMGRDIKFPCPQEVKDNAAELLIRVNKLIEILQEHNIPLEFIPKGFGIVDSGWRPPEINASIPNAAKKSKHMIGAAVDIYDPDGAIDEFINSFTGLDPHVNPLLEECGLYMEHPSATKGWCHVQSIPPLSGKRVFYP